MNEPILTEPAPAPEIFVDGYASSAINNGVCKMTFFSLMHDPANDLHERRVVMRLTMSAMTLAAVHQALGSFIDQLTAQAREEPGTQ